MANLRRLIQRVIPSGRFGRGVAALAGGTAAGQGVALLASPLLTRLYTPDDFGALGTFTALIGILSIVACARMELAIPLPDDDADAAAIGAIALGAAVIVATAVGFGVMLFGGRIAEWTNTPALARYGWLLVPGVLAIAAYQVLNYWAVRRRAYKQIAATKFTQGVSSVIVQLGGAAVNGPVGLLLGQVAIHAAGGTSLGRLFYREDRSVLRRVTADRARAMARRYQDFPLIQGPASLLNAVGLRIPALLVAGLFGSGAAGHFALGTRVIAAPVTFIGLSVSQVYAGELVRLVKTDPEAALGLYMTTVRKLAVLATVPALIITVASPWLFTHLFGSGWNTAGLMIQLLGVMYLAQLIVYPVSQTLVILERQRLQLMWDAGRAALTLISFFAPKYLGAGLQMTIAAYGAAMFVAYAVHFLLMRHELQANIEAQAR